MIRIILCEGKTDAILLSYYLERMCGWQHNKKPKKLKINLSDKENQFVGHYINNDDELLICAVGGKSNFIGFYEEYIEPYMLSGQDMEVAYRLAIVVDRDNESNEEIERNFSDNMGICISSIKNGIWEENSFENSFGQTSIVETLCVIIPLDKQGALETVLMEALSEDTYKGNLIEKSNDFVENIYEEARQIIANERLKLKAKLGVSLAVLYPEKVFSLIDEQIRSIPWECSEILNDCFHALIEI